MSFDRRNICTYLSVKWKKAQFFCYSIIVAVAIRVIGAVWLFHLLSSDGVFHTPWMDSQANLIIGWTTIPVPEGSSSWLWLFNAYDSPHFPLIAMLGYEHPNYVYLPGFPVLIRLTALFTGDYWFGAFIVTQVFALASIVAFQLLAGEYMPQREALYATLVMSTFPYVSVFTTLSYSESAFLFFTIATWYFYKKGRIGTSSLLAGITSVTRIYGFAIVLPIFLDIVKCKSYRKLFYLIIPIAFTCSWLFFCFLSTGDPLVSWTDQKYWVFDSKSGLGQYVLSETVRGIKESLVIHPGILVVVALFAFLVLKTWQVDRFLWAYAVSLFGALIFTTANHLSLLRYFPFIFPIWLTLKVRNPVVVVICVAFFVPVILIFWLYNLSAIFIG
ncbi:MAG TPA: hypothetical protein VJZ75_08600 [Candidatus Bathyarchaeia archaeon]|nr:hypothetical protein [Candidatus Bathyarchaeia archaeon]